MLWIWYKIPSGPTNMMTDDENFGHFKTYAVVEMKKGSSLKVWEHTEVYDITLAHFCYIANLFTR